MYWPGLLGSPDDSSAFLLNQSFAAVAVLSLAQLLYSVSISRVDKELKPADSFERYDGAFAQRLCGLSYHIIAFVIFGNAPEVRTASGTGSRLGVKSAIAG